MKFKDYLKAINELAEEYPESLEMEVIYSHDDEGNEYQKVINFPYLVEVEDLEDYRNLEILIYDEENREL